MLVLVGQNVSPLLRRDSSAVERGYHERLITVAGQIVLEADVEAGAVR